MKSITPAFVALTLLLGACSSFKARTVTHAEPPPAVRDGDKVTYWGPLPSYEQQAQYFRYRYIPKSVNRDLNGAVTVDALVNADGTVRDAQVFESSGNPEIDEAGRRMLLSAVYSLQLGPDDPAPHVVRHRVRVSIASERYNHVGGINTANIGNQGPQPDYGPPPPRTELGTASK